MFVMIHAVRSSTSSGPPIGAEALVFPVFGSCVPSLRLSIPLDHTKGRPEFASKECLINFQRKASVNATVD